MTYLIVKTWQKVALDYNISAQNNEDWLNSTRSLQLNKFVTSKDSIFSMGSKPEINNNQEKNEWNRFTFQIKTIEVRDKYGKNLNKKGTILVEQVDGDFDRMRIYDTSYLQNHNRLFFFRRVFKGHPSRASTLVLHSFIFETKYTMNWNDDSLLEAMEHVSV